MILWFIIIFMSNNLKIYYLTDTNNRITQLHNQTLYNTKLHIKRHDIDKWRKRENMKTLLQSIFLLRVGC